MSNVGIRQKVISLGVIFFFTLQIMLSPLAVNAATSTDGPVSHLFYQNNRLIAVVGNSIIQIPLSL